jgi:type III restriction enzyme
MREATVYFDSLSETASQPEDLPVLSEITADDSAYPRRASRLVSNFHWFKTPVNVVLTSHEPERRFTQRLFEPEIADEVTAWIKSPDTGFYGLSYSWRRGDHTKLGVFNPDFFLKLANNVDILAVELKDDGDVSDENRAKLKAALEHFGLVNGLQHSARYHVMFLSPQSYDAFFQQMRSGQATTFMSALQVALLE